MVSVQEKADDNGENRLNQRICLLFAVWFRKEHGLERYREYLDQASPIASEYGARRVEYFLPVEALRGDFDPDYISIVEWPDVDAYYAFLKDVHYRAIAPIREEAVRKSAVLHCQRMNH